MASQQSDSLFHGNYENFHEWIDSIEDMLSSFTIKNKSFDPDAPICCRNFFVMAKLVRLPPKDINFENGWTMDALLQETEAIYGPNPSMRQSLDSFETKIFDDKTADQVKELQWIVLNKILTRLGPKVPERLQVDRDDPFWIINNKFG